MRYNSHRDIIIFAIMVVSSLSPDIAKEDIDKVFIEITEDEFYKID